MYYIDLETETPAPEDQQMTENVLLLELGDLLNEIDSGSRPDQLTPWEEDYTRSVVNDGFRYGLTNQQCYKAFEVLYNYGKDEEVFKAIMAQRKYPGEQHADF